MQVIYIDILFVMNLMMDLMIFWISSQIIGKYYQKRKIIIGSIIAAILYCLTICIPVLQRLPYYIYYLFIPVIPILYIFRPIGLKEFVKMFIVCTLSAFGIGGATFSLYYLISYTGDIQSVPFWMPIIIGLLICIIITISFKWLRERLLLPHFEYQVTLCHKDKEKKISSIVDTGNCLYTILEHRPVTVVNYEEIKELLSEKEKELIKRCKEQGMVQTISELSLLNHPLYIIPFKSLGCKEGMIIGIEIERMVISRGAYRQELKKCIIGVSLETLFKDWKYEALLHPDLIIN